jgi:hypothetical protein
VSEGTAEKVKAPETVSNEKAQNTFSTAMIISGIRCAFTYVIFPILAPALGVASGVGSGIGLVASLIGIVANIYSIKRFHASNHHWKWKITFLNVSVIILLTVLLILDLTSLL